MILSVKVETKHPVDRSFGSEFRAICNHCVDMAARRRKTLKFCENIFAFFGKKRPLAVIFSKRLFRKFLSQHRPTLFSNFVKFGRREIGEIVRYLPDKKISPASQTVATARIAHKICEGQPPTTYSDSECSRFRIKSVHRVRGVIAERVNTVKYPRKV